MKARRWTHDDRGTRAWHATLRLGRLEVGYHVYRHDYGTHTSDRWVVQPFVTYDRKQAA